MKPYEDALKYILEDSATVNRADAAIAFLLAYAEAREMLLARALAAQTPLADLQRYYDRVNAVSNILDGYWTEYDQWDSALTSPVGRALNEAMTALKTATVAALAQNPPVLPDLALLARATTQAEMIAAFGQGQRESVVSQLNALLADWQAWAAYKTKLEPLYVSLFGGVANAAGEWKTFWATVESRGQAPVTGGGKQCVAYDPIEGWCIDWR
jgi:hypothetical protein